MRRRLVWLLTLVGALLLSGSGGVAASGANPVLDSLLPVAGALYNPCTGEEVRLSGEARVTVDETRGGQGPGWYHVQLTYLRLAGVGTETDSLYRVPARNQYQWSYAGESIRPSESSGVIWNLVSAEVGIPFRTTVVSKLSQQNGSWAVTVYPVQAVCR